MATKLAAISGPFGSTITLEIGGRAIAHDQSGTNRVGADVVASEFESKGLGERFHRGLRGRVDADVGRVGPCRARGHVDDASTTTGTHLGHESLTAPHDALDVHLDHRLQLLLGDVEDGGEVPDPGVVHERRARRDLFGHCHHRVAVSDIADERGSATQFSGLGCRVEVEIETHDVESVARQTQRVGSSQSLSGSGDHCDCHWSPTVFDGAHRTSRSRPLILSPMRAPPNVNVQHSRADRQRGVRES
jgi:hypothetical protein